MRPAPAFQVTIQHFGVWRAAVVLLMLATGGTTAAWLATLHADASMAGALARTALGLLTAGAVIAASTLLIPRPVSLRWDRQRWHLGPAATIGHEPQSGQLRVAIDLGAWLLLRFDPEGFGRRPPQWIPVQRRGLESAWHALRCTLYSPRPDGGPPPSDSALSASTRPLPPE